MFLPLLSVGSAAQENYRNRKRKNNSAAILKRSLEHFKMRYFKVVPWCLIKHHFKKPSGFKKLYLQVSL